jgi:hypothetical protein
MKTAWIAVALACASLAASAAGVEGVLKPGDGAARAPIALKLAVSEAATRLALPAIAESSRKSLEDGLAPNQIGVSRKDDVDRQARITQSSLQWRPAAGGFAAHLRIAAPGAAGLRVGLRFDAVPRELELRVAEAAADGTFQAVASTAGADLIKRARGVYPIEHWTASTEGAEQVIELWMPRRPQAVELRFVVDNVSHLLQRVTDAFRAKLLTCHVDVTCIADANVVNDAKAVARMTFTRGGRGFLCSGALLNDVAGSLTPFFATANHCISTQDAADTLETWFFYKTPVCNGAAPQGQVRVTGGAALLLADFDTDFAFLRLNEPAPAGAFFLGWDPAPLTAGQAIFGIHHPEGSFQRYSSGLFMGLTTVTNSADHITFADLFNSVRFTRGILEGGSSGSPLLTAPGNFHGTLFGGPASTSCSGNVFASYSNFTTTYPLIRIFLDGASAEDDHADSAGAATALPIETKLLAQINREGDADWFKFVIPAAGEWTVASFSPVQGAGIDVRGEVFRADAATLLASGDDISDTDRNFRIVRNVTPGTYYLRVTGVSGATGAYGVRSTFVLPDEYGDTFTAASDLPINGSKSGILGVLNDQDWFRLTFTESGAFRVSSTGATDTVGALYQGDGTTLIAENDDANPPDTNFGLAYSVPGPGTLYLKVAGFAGQRGPYGVQTSFTTNAVSASSNFNDMWWGGASESGWGINLNHQDNKIFASLFTYGADRAPMWLVATAERQSNGSFTGALYRTVGPAFNAPTWTGATATQVGTMTLAFAANNEGLLTYSVNGVNVAKQIQRQVFGTAPVTCTFTAASRNSATNYQDLWWNPAESGWGVNFAHQGTKIFATLFVYGANNHDLWLAATMDRQDDGSYAGDLSRTSGPPFNTLPWTAIGVTSVGSMRASFTNGASGTLTYTVDGVSVAKPIQRQVFAATQSICQ